MLQPDTIPKILGKFEIREKLSRGSMGVIYKAFDLKIERVVAIKVIDFSRFDEKDQTQLRERFLVEARATGQLSHPNILTIYDVGEEGQQAFIAMELIKGGTLNDTIKRKRLDSIDQAFSIVRQLAEGLEAAHSRDIIHRDIKPANILMLNGHTPKIADFGLARFADSRLTTPGTVLGTPNYMPPEQIEGKEVDSRADLFSLGAVFYEMLTGNTPFAGKSISSVINRVVKQDPVPPSHYISSFPESFDRFMEKALAKDPANRFQSAREFIVSMDHLQCARPAEGYAWEQDTKIATLDTLLISEKSRKLPWSIASGLCVVLLIFLSANLLGNADEGKLSSSLATQAVLKIKSPIPLSGKKFNAVKQEKVPEKAMDNNKATATWSNQGPEKITKKKKATLNKKSQKRQKRKKNIPERRTYSASLKVKPGTDAPKTSLGEKNSTIDSKQNTLLAKLLEEKNNIRLETSPQKEEAKETNMGSPELTSNAEKKKGFWTKIFNPDKGNIVINIQAGDKVVMDGKYYTSNKRNYLIDNEWGGADNGRTVDEEVPVGKHVIYIIRKGNRPFTKSVKLKKGQKMVITPDFS